MALVSLKGGAWWPEPAWAPQVINRGGARPTISSRQLDASGEKQAWMFQAPVTGDLAEIDYYINTVGSSGDLDVRIETVSATDGNPTGTLVATNSNLSATISTTGAKTAVLTAVAPLTRGTYYAIVFSRTSGNYNLTVQDHIDTSSYRANVLSYGRYHNGTSWSSQTAADSRNYVPCCALKWGDGNYYWIPGALPVQSVTDVNFNNASAERERGIRLIPRVPMRVSGWFANISMHAVDVNVILATSAGTAVGTYTGDKDYGSNYTTGTNYNGTRQGFFAETPTLVAGDTYYLTAKPTSATSTRVSDGLLMDTGEVNQWNMIAGGTDIALVTRDSGGTYTVDTTKRPVNFGLIIDQLGDDTGGGGGGLASNPIRGFVA